MYAILYIIISLFLSMNQKFLLIGVVVFVGFIAGLMYLAHLDATTPSSSERTFLSYAEDLDLDLEKFQTDIASDAVAQRVQSDIQLGDSKGVSSTPTFYINGEQERLPNDVAAMKALLDVRKEASEVQELPEGAHTKGSSAPKVIIEEFSDLECPACGAYAPTLKEFFETYPDDEISLVYRHYPLTTIHFYAESAAKATEAAALQGKFWEMHDLLFENQREWSR